MFAARFLFCLGLLAIAAPAFAQNAAETYLDQIASVATGTPSIDGIIRRNATASRAQAASNGISNFMITNNTSLSSGMSSRPSGGSIATLPRTGGGSKPFASLNRGSTVSPYLNLFNSGIGGGQSTVDNYNVLVRPQLDQQRVNRQLQVQTQQLNMRVQQIAAQPTSNPQGSEQIMPTGHSSTFGYYSRFYPALNQRRR